MTTVPTTTTVLITFASISGTEKLGDVYGVILSNGCPLRGSVKIIAQNCLQAPAE